MVDTLVLNKNFYAVHVIDWKRALSLLYQGHAQAVDENYAQYDFDDWRELSALMKEHPNGFVRAVNFKIAIPEIIKLTRYDKLPKRDVKFNRRNLYEHYKFKCGYCGEKFDSKELNLDHIVPRSRGGKTTWANIITTCIPCNTKKRDRTPEEAGMNLLVKPTKPRWRGNRSYFKFSVKLPMKKSWQKIIDAKYWNTELES